MEKGNSDFSNKYFVFIVSAGRTGTRYFGQVLSGLIGDSFSVHEPDVLTPRKGYGMTEKLRTFGFNHLVLGKLRGKTGIRNLSQNYLSGQLSLKELENEIIRHRIKYYASIGENLIIESYSGWYGCLPAIKEVYRHHKIIVVARDPRSWVTSAMNWSALFGKRDWVSRLGLQRLNPMMIGDEDYTGKWAGFSRFEKICWTYKTQYELMMKHVRGNPDAMVIKFEDLFYSENKYDNLEQLLKFMTSYEDKRFEYSVAEDVLERKVHSGNAAEFPEYPDWDDEHKQILSEVCGGIMKDLGYQ